MIGDSFKWRRGAAPALLAGALTFSAVQAAKAEDCTSLHNPVIVAGSSAVKPFLAKVAAALGKLEDPITVVYQSQGSCAGVNYLAASSPSKLSGTGVIFDENGADKAGGCTLADTTVDIGVSDVYAASCGVDSLPSGVKDFYGPIQGMTFVVPKMSNQTIISAEAAYLVFGLGKDGEVDPWTDENMLIRRNEGSGTQQMISAALNVPAAKWKGKDAGGSDKVVTELVAAASSGNADKAIGIVATDRADVSRSMVKILGYQHYGQSCAFWPDADVNSFDKINVRDGHYPIWGPLHMFAKVDGDKIASENAKKIIEALSGVNVPEGLDLIQIEAKAGVVPECAMHVKRTKDGGELSSFQPEKECGCKFAKEATGETPEGCKECENNDDCPSEKPACNYKYCEVK